MKDYNTFLKNRVTIKYITTKHLRQHQVIKIFLLGNFLPIACPVVTTAIDLQTEHTLSPGTCAHARCSSRPGIQYFGVHLTASLVLSHVRTLLFGLRLDDLKTNDAVQFKLWAIFYALLFAFFRHDLKIISTGNSISFNSIEVHGHYLRIGLNAVQFRNIETWKQHSTAE